MVPKVFGDAKVRDQLKEIKFPTLYDDFLKKKILKKK